LTGLPGSKSQREGLTAQVKARSADCIFRDGQACLPRVVKAKSLSVAASDFDVTESDRAGVC
jgi:hypothetical protein